MVKIMSNYWLIKIVYIFKNIQNIFKQYHIKQ